MPEDSSKHPWVSRLRESADQAEEEVQRLIHCLNDEVVPEVRRNGSAALKKAASELHRLAERIDQANQTPPPAPPPKRP